MHLALFKMPQLSFYLLHARDAKHEYCTCCGRARLSSRRHGSKKVTWYAPTVLFYINSHPRLMTPTPGRKQSANSDTNNEDGTLGCQGDKSARAAKGHVHSITRDTCHTCALILVLSERVKAAFPNILF